jgi:hypothetical protein
VLLMKALIPKSVILASPARFIRMLAGLMSRWTCRAGQCQVGGWY